MSRHCKTCPKSTSECDNCDECQKRFSVIRSGAFGLGIGIVLGAGMFALISYVPDVINVILK